MAYKKVYTSILHLGRPVLRIDDRKDGPVITDNGNFIIDLYTSVNDPKSMENELNDIPGIFENGIFTCKCEAIFMKKGKLEVIKSK